MEMTDVLVTGGAGFIGRWVVKRLLQDGHRVVALDDLSNGREANIKEFSRDNNFEFIKGDVKDPELMEEVISRADICLHLAAQINVQESLDNPPRAFLNNVLGTYYILEACRKHNVKLVLMGTCMVYDMSSGEPIGEEHKIKPASPYAGSKVAAEEMALSYYFGLGLPVVIVRPFNTYGPFQKTNMEGGVVSIFIGRNLEGETLNIYGDGTQTRDLLYVEDCADFVVKAAFSPEAEGQVFNAGTGEDITINDLALLICKDEKKIKHVPHHHPQAEIQRLVCDYSKARRILAWEPSTSLEEGIRKTEEWLKKSGSP